METSLLDSIKLLNGWLADPKIRIFDQPDFIYRRQIETLLLPDWDKLWIILVGPRQSGKTTMGKYLCQRLVDMKRRKTLLYLNCDYLEIRDWLKQGVGFIKQAIDQFNLEEPIFFIDEVQRLDNPGLLLKSIVDLQLPIKLIASGSSQLEIKSATQEHLTGRHIEAVVLPLSQTELNDQKASLTQSLIFGSYPQIVLSGQKEILLRQLYNDYINKDIIEILKVGKPDMMQNLVALTAHCAGQLVNYQQLAIDCRVTISTIQNYLSILEKTYVIKAIKPFVGNKRTEITSNPIYYFIDNGFRNQALKNLLPVENRLDAGLLVENFVFQEMEKYKTQNFQDWNIYYWRTKSGAEIDFIIKHGEEIVPVEVKYQNMRAPKLTRGFRSFLQAYQPRLAIVITKSFTADVEVEGGLVHFLPLDNLSAMFDMLNL